MSTEVRPGTSADLDSIATLLGAAFADYPWTRWCVDGDDHVARITELQRISLELLGLPFGLVWVGESDGQPVSAAVWSDSRVDFDRSIFTELADRSRPLHGDRLVAAIEAESGGQARPAEPHLFLETMGTHPNHRRAGHGSAVLGPGLERADHSSLACGLETSTEENVSFYTTMGFRVTHHRVVTLSGTGETGPDVWTMWREPAQP